MKILVAAGAEDASSASGGDCRASTSLRKEQGKPALRSRTTNSSSRYWNQDKHRKQGGRNSPFMSSFLVSNSDSFVAANPFFVFQRFPHLF